MSKLRLLGTALRSNFTVQTVRANHGLPLLLRDSPRRFSTESEQPPQDSAVESFLQTPDRGLVYGKLVGVSRHTLKRDVINMLEGCKLTLDDLKVDYNGIFTPLGMMVQFPSRYAYEQALRVVSKKGRLYRLERADCSQWDIIKPYNGKTVLLQGLPRFASTHEVERFLSDEHYAGIDVFPRNGPSGPFKMALVRFSSQIEAMSVVIKKNRGFCLNSQILMRVLQ